MLEQAGSIPHIQKKNKKKQRANYGLLCYLQLRGCFHAGLHNHFRRYPPQTVPAPFSIVGQHVSLRECIATRATVVILTPIPHFNAAVASLNLLACSIQESHFLRIVLSLDFCLIWNDSGPFAFLSGKRSLTCSPNAEVLEWPFIACSWQMHGDGGRNSPGLVKSLHFCTIFYN